MNTIYLSLGSNIGERHKNIDHALELLHKRGKVIISKCSSFYETDPVGFVDQPPFLNVAVEGQTKLQPLELLNWIHEVEQELGRTREVRWGPRIIDIDILLYNSIRMHDDQLVIPHPRMAERAFVLVPLAEIAADLCIPGSHNDSIKERIQTVGEEGVRLWKIH